MKFDDLKFVRLRTDISTDPDGSLARMLFNRIPIELFKQIKNSDFKIERIRQFAPLALMQPLTFFYILSTDDDKIKGFLWAEINPLTENLFVHTLSIDKEYQGGDALEKAFDFIDQIRQEQNLKKIQMVTVCPKTYEKKHGWVRSKKIIMEK